VSSTRRNQTPTPTRVIFDARGHSQASATLPITTAARSHSPVSLSADVECPVILS
jgi:hypothetical protein